MDEQIKKTRAAALREELRNGRNGTPNEPGNATDEPGQDAGGVSAIDADTLGATFQDARGAAEHFTPTGDPPQQRDRRNRNNQRGTTRQSERPGRRDRRTEKGDSGGTADRTDTQERPGASANERPGRRGIGRLETNEVIDEPTDFTPDEPAGTFEGRANGPVSSGGGDYCKEDFTKINPFGKGIAYALKVNKKHRITPEEYDALPASRSASTNGKGARSEEQPGPGTAPAASFFKGGVLSKQEAEDYYEPLIAALSDSFGYIDRGLWHLCPQLDERPIWSNTTGKEDATIAKMLLKRGQKSPATAAVVRTMIDSADYVVVGMAVLPRIGETVQAMRERPAPAPGAKKGFSVFRKAGA